jgi:hypothetical protein
MYPQALAVILSAAKDPDEPNATLTDRLFQPTLSTPLPVLIFPCEMLLHLHAIFAL